MSGKYRWPLLLATILGLGAALWAFGREGWQQVLVSAARVGAGGFIALCIVTILTFFLLGAAWLVAVPGQPASRIGRFAWARAAREGANDLLPFSQLGGLVVGARTLTCVGIDQARVYAAMIVDLTTEMASQLVFTLFALWAFATMLSGKDVDARLMPMLWGGIGVATLIMFAFVGLQRPVLRFAAFLGARMLPDAGLMAQGVSMRLAEVYGRPRRILASFLLNLAAWAATAGWSWLALRLMGAPAGFAHVAALESAIFALKSVAFLVPGALGVQEAGYALLAPVMGIDPRAALALSLVRRARDVALGLPTLVIWQAGELRGRRPAPQCPAANPVREGRSG